MSFKKKLLTAQLPPTPCTQEMRESLIEVAEREGRSLADLQRSAIALFLSASGNKIDRNVSIIEQEPA